VTFGDLRPRGHVPGSIVGSHVHTDFVCEQDQTETTRKIVNRVTPAYPEMARSMNLRGSMKAEVVVAPNGTVKLVDVKGGHPHRRPGDESYKREKGKASRMTGASALRTISGPAISSL
jgi:TonB-like protein